MVSMDLISQMRKKITGEEFDYLLLLNCLKDYKRPRDKITKLIKNETILRVKKGLYVFGPLYRKRPYSLEVLANLIYGPSYISFEYALSYYGLIPETVKRVTSASYKKNKTFETDLASFVYYPVHKEAFSIGIQSIKLDSNTYFLMASKEKALVDFIARLKKFTSTKELCTYLTDSLRIEPSEIKKLNMKLLSEIQLHYKNKNVSLLCEI